MNPGRAALAVLLASACAAAADKPPVMTPPRALPGHGIGAFFPENAFRCREEGYVTLELLINDKGTVSTARIVSSSGYSDLDEAARKDMLTWRYVPATANGKAVAARWLARTRFAMPERPSLMEVMEDVLDPPDCPEQKSRPAVNRPRSK